MTMGSTQTQLFIRHVFASVSDGVIGEEYGVPKETEQLTAHKKTTVIGGFFI